jgi:FtsZ-binding cell division protein ZapB
VERIDTLTKKVHLAAEQLTRMKKEKEKLQTELKYLQEENKRIQIVTRENEQLHAQQVAIAHRIEKLLKKMKHE